MQHVVTLPVEILKEDLDEDFFVGAVLTDHSKAFDCIAHDFLHAKLVAHGFSDTSLRFIYST